MPEVWRQLEEGARALEADCRDVQDMEFTVERGRLFFLQTRAAKRTPRAALKIAVDLVEEGLIGRKDALKRLAATDLEATGVSRFAEPAETVARATVASPGVACGQVCFSTAQAKETAARGEPAILVRRDTSTEDIEGFAVAPEFSRRSAGAPPMPRSWPGSWARSAWSAAARS